MNSFGRRHDQVGWMVVRLVAVSMMNLLVALQDAPNERRPDQAVLVHVAAHIGQRMAGDADENVPRAGDSSPAAPVGIPWAVISAHNNTPCLGFAGRTGSRQPVIRCQ